MAYNSTAKALFQTPQGLWIDATIKGADMASSHFAWYEIWNYLNSTSIKMKMYSGSNYNSWRALDCLEFLRDRLKMPLTIGTKDQKGGSGWREEAYNKKVGGVSNSLHLYACAFDLQFGPVSDAFYQTVRNLVELACYAFAVNGVPLQAECGRYSWGIHVGWCVKLPYSFNGIVYEFDER